MKDHYYSQLAEYKKTHEYAHYQNYLEDFKSKHEPSSKSQCLWQAILPHLIYPTDGKRLKEDKTASPGRRSSDERLQSSPDHRGSCTSSIEQQNGNRRQSAIGSPQTRDSLEWRPRPRSDNTPPDMMTPDSNTSPQHNKPAFSSINGIPSNTPAHMQPRRTSTLSGSPMNHPMAISTSMAYGYHPMLAAHHPSDSPPNIHTRRPTLASETSLPSLRHSDSLGSSSAGSPVNTSAPVFSAPSRALPNRELPPPFPSRPSCYSQSLPPMKAPGSPSRYSPSTSGLATLLLAGEHLASETPDMRVDYNQDPRCS